MYGEKTNRLPQCGNPKMCLQYINQVLLFITFLRL